ncbi:MAG: hypothetical protein ACREAM_28580 [Blastocatellia bacterium]
MTGERTLYRVEFVLPITNERQLWSNYLNLRDAEEAAYGLITSGHAVETEVFAVTNGGQRTSVYHARREKDGAILTRRTNQ